jgi:hypothetical protein
MTITELASTKKEFADVWNMLFPDAPSLGDQQWNVWLMLHEEGPSVSRSVSWEQSING